MAAFLARILRGEEAVVCAGDSGRTLTLANVNAFGSPKGLQFEFEVGWGGVRTSYPVLGDPTVVGPGNVTVQLAQVVDSSKPTGKRDAKPADFASRFDARNPEASLLREADFAVLLDDGSVTTLAAAGVSFNHDDVQWLAEQLDSVVVNVTQASSASGTVSRGKLSLDLNKFLRVGDTLQVVFRRIH